MYNKVMENEIKECQNCKKDFVIESEPQHRSKAWCWTSLTL